MRNNNNRSKEGNMLFRKMGKRTISTAVIMSMILTFFIMPVSVSAASITTNKYYSLPDNQGLLKNGYYQDDYRDYNHVVTINVVKKNTTVTLKEYAGGPYIAEYTYVDGHTKKVGKNKKCKYSNSINVSNVYGYDVKVSRGLFHTTKIKFKKPGVYTLTVTFRTKKVLYPTNNVNRYVNDKYPTWNLKYDNKRVKNVSVDTQMIDRF